MLATVNVFGQSVSADVDATREKYASRTPNSCSCCYCRNVRAQWSSALSPEVRSALALLGIDPDKPGAMSEFGPYDGARLAEVEWPFVGPADAGARESRSDLCVNTVTVAPGGMPCGDDFAAESRWSASVVLHVPWVLDEPEPAS